MVEWWKRYGGALTLIFATGAMISLLAMVTSIRWTGTQDAPAWVQAVGSLIAIAVAIFVPLRQQKLQHEADIARDCRAENRRQIMLKNAAELAGVRAEAVLHAAVSSLKTPEGVEVFRQFGPSEGIILAVISALDRFDPAEFEETNIAANLNLMSMKITNHLSDLKSIHSHMKINKDIPAGFIESLDASLEEFRLVQKHLLDADPRPHHEAREKLRGR